MADLYTRLAALGLDRRFLLDTVLPPGWADRDANSAAGRAQAEQALAVALGLRPAALSVAAAPIEFLGPTTGPAHRRTEAPTTVGEQAGIRVARRGAALGLQAWRTPGPPWLRELSARDLRAYVLKRHPVVNLRSLAEAAWTLGVPVLPLRKRPKMAARRGIDGLTVSHPGRLVVVLAGRLDAPGWMLWALAHQLGHIAAGHLDTAETLDRNMLSPTEPSPETVAWEAAAQRFADELVLGTDPPELQATDRITGVKLAHLARTAARATALDASGLVTRFALGRAWTGGDARGAAKRALRIFGVDGGGAPLLSALAAPQLDLGRLDEAEAYFVRRVLGL